uniref:Helitron_like_N domain-containing protein n=1 Tax=Schistocephalus solidus TaxID=70667 RepID=A0A183SXT7_SCHSO
DKYLWIKEHESDKPCQRETKTCDIPVGSCKLGSGSCSSLRNIAVLKAFTIAQLNEKRVRREVELERAILDDKIKTELARVEAEAKTDVDLGDDADNVKYLERTARVAQCLQECTVKDVALEGSVLWIKTVSPRANTMTPLVASLELPKVELYYFDGNPPHYSNFFRQFEVYVESKVEDPAQRLLCLTQYCRADARAANEECVMLPLLRWHIRKHERYFETCSANHILLHGPFSRDFLARQTTHTTKSLSDLCITIKGCEIALTQMNYLSDLHSLTALGRIARFLTKTLQNQWAEVTYRTDPNLADLTEFVEMRSRIARSRFGQLAREGEARDRQNASNNTVQRQRHQGRTTFLVFSGAASGPQPLFICSQTHDVASCPRLLSTSVADSWNRIRESKACFVCLDKTQRTL